MRKLKIFGIPWHSGHQHELCKLPFVGQYDFLINPYREWADSSRPFPPNGRRVTYFRRGYYDFAILHVDQQSIYNLEKGDRISKGKLYAELRDVIGDDCPVVTINHMTPFHDKYDADYVVNWIKKLTEGSHMVVNSFESARQWGWGYTITHGLDPKEWWDLPKEPRAVTVLSPAGMEQAYRRVFITTVQRYLEEMGVNFYWILGDKKCNSFNDYRDFLGRSLVYFNGTWQSPRPRARTEAMFSGCCVVSTRYQDADTFIEDGKNGFLTSKFPIMDPRVMDNPQETAQLIKRLVLDEPDLALKIGQEGKKTAMKLFTSDKFKDQWIKFLREEVKINVD